MQQQHQQVQQQPQQQFIYGQQQQQQPWNGQQVMYGTALPPNMNGNEDMVNNKN